MKTYVVELYHDAGMSPLANAKVREHARSASEALHRLMAEKGVVLDGDYHLDPEHRLILICRADSVETVRDVLYESGMMHYNDGRIYPASTLKEVRERGFQIAPIL